MSLKYTRAVAKAQGLSPKAKNLLRVLADRANQSGTSFARQTTLAADLGVSERTIRTALKELEMAQWIVREKRYRRDGTRTADLVTVRDLAGAARAAAAALKLPLMMVIAGARADDAPVDKRPLATGDHRQILPVDQPANPAGYREPITSTDDSNRPRRAARAGGDRSAAMALLDDVYGPAVRAGGGEGHR